ncbi:hypothetical protein GINT2_001962 [Glugoides intestinalis]
MDKEEETSLEERNIQINIFESTQVDFRPKKQKKVRKIDDYDYNDPFLEPFEGEFDAVELECKLDNFFIYKGRIQEEPKRIAKKYNNSLKKHKLIDTLNSSCQNETMDMSKSQNFEFERMLANSINKNYKYKKDSRFINGLAWLFFTETPNSEFKRYLNQRALEKLLSKPGCEMDKPDNFEEEIESLRVNTEGTFNSIMKQISDEKNYTANMKNFEKFKDEMLIEELTSFIMNYVAYSIINSCENINYVVNLAVEYLIAAFPEQCTNKIRIKYYVLKNTLLKIETSGYDVEKALSGEFEKKEEIEVKEESKKQEEAEFSPESSFKPSFNESTMMLENTASAGKKYSYPKVPLFSTPFFNTTQFKANLTSENEKTVSLEDVADSKQCLEYIDPTSSIDDTPLLIKDQTDENTGKADNKKKATRKRNEKKAKKDRLEIENTVDEVKQSFDSLRSLDFNSEDKK